MLDDIRNVYGIKLHFIIQRDTIYNYRSISTMDLGRRIKDLIDLFLI